MKEILELITPLTWWEKRATRLLNPVMRLLAGKDGYSESPQQTHPWNHASFDISLTSLLDPAQMVRCAGITTAKPSHWYGINRCHMPIFGGWENYVVLEQLGVAVWYVGWITPTNVGVSRVPLYGPVRMLIGPQDVSFFALDKLNKRQRKIHNIGQGKIGQGGISSMFQLL